MIFALLYLLFFILGLTLVFVVYRRVMVRGRIWALGASFLSLVFFSLFLPIPIHGGFTFPLEIAWGELQREWSHHEAKHEAEKRETLTESMQQRFAGVLEDVSIERSLDGWDVVRLSSGQFAWRDRVSHLFWLAPQTVQTTEALLSLETATRFCRQQSPWGYWGMPSEAELALLWQHSGHRLMPGSGQSGAALLADPSLGRLLVTHYRGRVAGHALRCVARDTGAPPRGYLQPDIPLELWNNYQLHKAEIYASATQGAVPAPGQEIK